MSTQAMPVSKNAPVYQRQLHLPHPDSISDAEVKAKLIEVGQLREKAEQTKADAGDAGFKVEAAEAEDRQREADHARGKLKAKPKPTAPAAQQKAEAAERAAAVAAIAASDAESELMRLIGERGPELAEAERTAAAEAVTKAHAAAITVGEHLAARQGFMALALWFDDPASPRTPTELGSTAILKQNNAHVSPGEGLQVVIDATDPDPEPERTPDIRTQREHDRWRERQEAKATA
jgi:hypothetical protein